MKDDDNTSFQQLKDSTIIITKISILLVFEENDYDDWTCKFVRECDSGWKYPKLVEVECQRFQVVSRCNFHGERR